MLAAATLIKIESKGLFLMSNAHFAPTLMLLYSNVLGSTFIPHMH